MDGELRTQKSPRGEGGKINLADSYLDILESYKVD